MYGPQYPSEGILWNICESPTLLVLLYVKPGYGDSRRGKYTPHSCSYSNSNWIIPAWNDSRKYSERKIALSVNRFFKM